MLLGIRLLGTTFWCGLSNHQAATAQMHISAAFVSILMQWQSQKSLPGGGGVQNPSSHHLLRLRGARPRGLSLLQHRAFMGECIYIYIYIIMYVCACMYIYIYIYKHYYYYY